MIQQVTITIEATDNRYQNVMTGRWNPADFENVKDILADIEDWFYDLFVEIEEVNGGS